MEKRVRAVLGGWNIWQQRRKIVIKNIGGFVIRILFTVGADITGAKITGGIVSREMFLWRCLDLPFPRTLGPMRRNQDPFAGPRVVAAGRGPRPTNRLPPLLPPPRRTYLCTT